MWEISFLDVVEELTEKLTPFHLIDFLYQVKIVKKYCIMKNYVMFLSFIF